MSMTRSWPRRTLCATRIGEWFGLLALLLGPSARAQEPAVGELLLHPADIVISGRLETSPDAKTGKFAVEFIGKEIDLKRAADEAAARLPAFWKASFWKYLPVDPGGTLNSPTVSDDDPFLTPAYLTLAGRLLEREVIASDKRTELLFGK